MAFMKEIALSKQGKNKGKYFAIVDDEDYDWLNSYRWCFDGRYAQRRNKIEGHVRMHIFIMNPPEGMGVDHKNGNQLDFRRCNLRICSQWDNSKNMSKHADGKSKYKGLTQTKNGKWFARINYRYEHISIGLFESEEEAAKAYDKKAKEIYGEYAKLNFPEHELV